MGSGKECQPKTARAKDIRLRRCRKSCNSFYFQYTHSLPAYGASVLVGVLVLSWAWVLLTTLTGSLSASIRLARCSCCLPACLPACDTNAELCNRQAAARILSFCLQSPPEIDEQGCWLPQTLTTWQSHRQRHQNHVWLQLSSITRYTHRKTQIFHFKTSKNFLWI